MGQIMVWDQVDGSDRLGRLERTSVWNPDVKTTLRTISDLDVDLGQITVWTQGNLGRFGQVVDMGQLTVWEQGSDLDGFGHSLQEQFPQLLLGKGSCFGVSCILFGVLPPDPILALLDLQELLLSPPLGLEEFFIMPLHGCVKLDLELLTGFDQCFNCSLVLPDGLSAG